MRITAPGGDDLEIRPGTSAAQIFSFLRLDGAWCGNVRLDPDHPAGVPPLVNGARLTTTVHPPCLPPTGTHLAVVEGPDSGHVVPLDETVVVGRSADADLTLADAAVSLEHAIITGGARTRVRDLRSANGTSAPRWRRLRAGDELQLGRSRVMLMDPDAALESDQSRSNPGGGDASRRWGMVAGGLASGIMLAALTGRWQLALVGLLPAAVPLLTPVFTRRRHNTAGARTLPSGTVAVRGEDEAVRGYVRALLIDRGRRLTDERWHEPWVRWLAPPHGDDRIIGLAPGAPWPSWCAQRVEVHADRRIEDRGDGPQELLPLHVSASTADVAARRQAARGAEDGMPKEISWADLSPPDRSEAAGAGPRQLHAAIGATSQGTFVLDLDADGPHVLVAGTTGSGKSIALETMIAALAYHHPPRDLTLALIDFKGGAGLQACMELPHVSATLTDLDGSLARRALTGLTHELASRKEALRERGFASLAQWETVGGAPPRLLVVIDEYQEIVTSHPTFVPDLARVAAQGRSLGLHLVLATQRPAGAVTPEVRANVSTTIALRVASGAESRDLLGTPDAAAIPAWAPGRAIIARGAKHHEVQIAVPSHEPSAAVRQVGAPRPPGTPLALEAAQRWRDEPAATPLWLPPLPDRWRASGPVDGTVTCALVDRPHERHQATAGWNPRDGALLLIGPPGSGRTSGLRAIAEQSRVAGLEPVMLPTDPRLASRTLALAANQPHVLLLIDDLDATAARLMTVDDGAAMEDLAARTALRLPTAMAGGPATPLRLGTSASLIAVMTGLDPTTAAGWGVPRSLLEHAGPAARGRAHLRSGGAWDVAQLAWSDAQVTGALTSALPDEVDADALGDALGIGGDHARPVPRPTGPVVIVGPHGRTSSALMDRLTGVDVSTVDLPALVPPGSPSVLLAEPTARAVRQLAPHGWRGLTAPHPIDGRAVLIHEGVATAIQVPSG